jgi:toxin ParE1/3/4
MPRAEADLDEIFLFIRATVSPPAERWFVGLLDAIASLDHHPQRHPVAHEDNALRHLLYGNKPHIYRVIFFIDEAGQRVEVLHVRHHARRAFQPEDLQ